MKKDGCYRLELVAKDKYKRIFSTDLSQSAVLKDYQQLLS